MNGFVGFFTHLPEGRAFLVQIPGVAQAPLDNAEVAEVLNWILLNFSLEQPPEDFEPCTPEEVGEYRGQRLRETTKTREHLLARLKSTRVLSDDDIP